DLRNSAWACVRPSRKSNTFATLNHVGISQSSSLTANRRNSSSVRRSFRATSCSSLHHVEPSQAEDKKKTAPRESCIAFPRRSVVLFEALPLVPSYHTFRPAWRFSQLTTGLTFSRSV